jgi:hypothetical protein
MDSHTIKIIGVFVGLSRIFLLGVLIFKGLTARRPYKSFGVKGLIIVYINAIDNDRWIMTTGKYESRHWSSECLQRLTD